MILIQFRGASAWFHSITSDQDVNEFYDYVERMLLEQRYLDPPASLEGRHFQRYVVDTIDERHYAVKS